MSSLAILSLFAPMFLGYVCGYAGIFPDTAGALAALNRYALHVAFPLMVILNLLQPSTHVPEGAIFPLAHAAGFLTGMALLAALILPFRSRRHWFAPFAFGTLYSNIGYLGIPFCQRVLGEASVGTASLSAALHIVLTVTLVPIAVLWVRREHGSLASVPRDLMRQPLLWAPIVGVLGRMAGSDWLLSAFKLVEPVAKTASPVGLFIVGLYLCTQSGLLRWSGEMVAFVTGKLLIFPAIFALIGAFCLARGWFTPMEHQVFIFEAAMPTGVSAFPLAFEYRARPEVVARGIVISTLLSLMTLPLLVWLVG